MATVLMDQARLDEAITVYLKVLKINPGNENARYNLGIAYYNTRNISAAAENHKEALRLNPNADHIRAAITQVKGKN